MAEAAEPNRAAPDGSGSGVVENALSAVRAAEFARLLGENQRRVALYVMTLVPDWNDADEIMQETAVYLWEAFNRFEPGTNFFAWACKVAHFRVLARRERKSNEKVQFSSAFLESIAERLSTAPERWEERERRLAECIEKLPAEHRTVVTLRYLENCEMEALASKIGRTLSATYSLLSRIRHNLYECVGRGLSEMRR
jgi:RNA polymerase sigma-70 factor (ECF subfamily)